MICTVQCKRIISTESGAKEQIASKVPDLQHFLGLLIDYLTVYNSVQPDRTEFRLHIFGALSAQIPELQMVGGQSTLQTHTQACRDTQTHLSVGLHSTRTRPFAAVRRNQRVEACCRQMPGCSNRGREQAPAAAGLLAASGVATWLLGGLPAGAEEAVDFSQGSFSQQSYWVSLGLFIISLPGTFLLRSYESYAPVNLQLLTAGLWSLVKRAPKASRVRKTFEVEGPGQAGQQVLDRRAQEIFRYFKKYNYEVKATGETITFAGQYAASKGQAAALVFYVFCGASKGFNLLLGSWMRCCLLGIFYKMQGWQVPPWCSA